LDALRAFEAPIVTPRFARSFVAIAARRFDIVVAPTLIFGGMLTTWRPPALILTFVIRFPAILKSPVGCLTPRGLLGYGENPPIERRSQPEELHALHGQVDPLLI
jgi:hypothetical protein